MNIKRLVVTLQAVGVCLLTAAICVFLYCYDNKYTAPGPRGLNGTLFLDENDADQCNFLVSGWVVYGGVLLSPDNFALHTPRPDAYVFIGQYGGFEKLIGSPHGSVTYRLLIGIPEETRSYTLWLPEIFSSCRVYINGTERFALGETDPQSYRFETGNAAITFDAGGKIELLIAVSDFRHLYSGMVYPPAIGSPEAVSGTLSARFAVRCAACAASLVIGLISLFIGLMSKNKGLAVLYGLLCLLFTGYTAYPVIMTFIRGSVPLYALENLSFNAMLLIVFLLHGKISRRARGVVRSLIFGYGSFTCFAALILPLITPYAGLPLMTAYSVLITSYQWIIAVYITVSSGLLTRVNETATPLFSGILILDITLIMDRILHNYEPIITGWFPELGSFAMVIAIGITAAGEVISQFRENAVMEERVKVIISSGREHYLKMNEMYSALSIMRHDYKYHLSAARNMLVNREEAEAYLSDVESRLSENELPVFCENSVINALLASYYERCKKLRVLFDAKIFLPANSPVPDYALCIILGNLLENAVEACSALESGAKISLSVKSMLGRLAIMTSNNYPVNKEPTPKKGGGLGLKSIQAVAEKYGGELLIERKNGIYTAYVTLEI